MVDFSPKLSRSSISPTFSLKKVTGGFNPASRVEFGDGFVRKTEDVESLAEKFKRTDYLRKAVGGIGTAEKFVLFSQRTFAIRAMGGDGNVAGSNLGNDFINVRNNITPAGNFNDIAEVDIFLIIKS